jgi:uncharacterized membrane protein
MKHTNKIIPNNSKITSPKFKYTIDKVFSTVLIAAIIIATISLSYILIFPKSEEKFTEFYILTSSDKTTNYPRNITLGKNTSVIIGIANHEEKTINYTIEIWLINQTHQENKTVYQHAWYLNKINVILNNTPYETVDSWKPQWEYNYTFRIDKKGNYKIIFLLFPSPKIETYSSTIDYKDSIEEKINSAYRDTYLLLTIS